MAGTGSSPDRSRYQEGIIRRGYEHRESIALQRLGEIVSDLYLAEGGQANRLWANAKAALDKVAADDPQAAKILKQRKVEDLAKFLNTLTREAKTANDKPADADLTQPDDASAPPAAPARSTMTLREELAARAAAAPPPTAEELKRAMKMFRKRVKLKRLDDESKLGRSPLTSGKQSKPFSIPAPREFPANVWEELARQGKLRDRGGGFYELLE